MSGEELMVTLVVCENLIDDSELGLKSGRLVSDLNNRVNHST